MNFFKAYPEMAKLDFHISGESYGGVYVPFVADAVLTGNQQGDNAQINLKGILIGNGVGGVLNRTEQVRRESDFFYDTNTLSHIIASSSAAPSQRRASRGPRSTACVACSRHAMYSYQQQKRINAACDWNSTEISNQCEEEVNTALQGVGNFYMSARALQKESPGCDCPLDPHDAHPPTLLGVFVRAAITSTTYVRTTSRRCACPS